MAFEELPEIGIVDFIERRRVREPLWGFVHVPKAAGTSLAAGLVKNCGPHRKIFPKSYLVSPEEFRASEWESVHEFVALQRSRREGAQYRSFSGHIRRPHTDFIRAEFPETRLFAILRDPVSRVISEYRYCLTPRHPPHEEFARNYPTLLDYALHIWNQNLMTKYLAASHRVSPEEVVKSVTSYFDFLGIAEMYDLSISAIFRMIGVTPPPQERLNITPSSERNTFPVDDDVIRRIRQVNLLDEAIYQHVRGVLASNQAAWETHSLSCG